VAISIQKAVLITTLLDEVVPLAAQIHPQQRAEFIAHFFKLCIEEALNPENEQFQHTVEDVIEVLEASRLVNKDEVVDDIIRELKK